MKDRFPIIDNIEVLEPLVIQMTKGGTLPMDAIVYTRREWDFISKCMNGGHTTDVNLNQQL